MKKKFPKILSIINIIIPIILLFILLIAKLSEDTIYIMMMTVIIGWLIPYITPLITGLALLNKSHHKRALLLNICSILLSIFCISMIIILFDKHFIIMLIEYIIIIILNIINTIYLIIYIKKHPNLENKRIKEIKKKNNGAIV